MSQQNNTPELQGLLLYLLVKSPGMTACPTVFPLRLSLLCLAQKIEKKINFQLAGHIQRLFEIFLLFNSLTSAVTAYVVDVYKKTLDNT